MRLVDTKEYKAVYKLIFGFFNDKAKADSWMLCENCDLGGMSPVDMIMLGQGARLEKMVKQALEQNEPPTAQ